MPATAARATPERSRVLIGALAAMSGLAWLALWQAGPAPFGHGLHGHGAAPRVDSSVFGPGVLFVAGWTTMSVAMMLPTTAPLVTLFAFVTRHRRHRGLLVSLVWVGYLVAWIGAGAIAYVLVVGLQQVAAASGWLRAHSWAAASAACVAAGAFQFSSFKYVCLDRCRSPFSFVNEHWTGAHERRDALRLGLHHGLFCVGCCWALMLLMIPLGAGHLLWMLVLGALMAIEKNVSWGRAAVKPLGVALILLGLSIAALGPR